MHVFLFEERFVPLILSGVKRHTIRQRRKRPVKAGDDLSLRRWSAKAYRSPMVELLRSPCLGCWPLAITEKTILITGLAVEPGKLDNFARADGFESFEEMRQWHREAHGLPFYGGELIRWSWVGRGISPRQTLENGQGVYLPPG